MSEQILISIILPTYNRKVFLERCIQSVLDQTYSNFELIIIDDGSTDGTAELVRQFSDPRLKYYWKENQKFPSIARNFGVKQAKSEWIAFIDSDDTWERNKLEIQLSSLNLNPKAALISTLISIDNKLIKNHRTRHSYDYFNDLLWRNFIFTSTVLLKKSIFNEFEGFDQSLQIAEDYDLWLKISAKYPVMIIDQPTARYEIHDGGISSNKEKTLQAAHQVVLACCQRQNVSAWKVFLISHFWKTKLFVKRFFI